jgi:hypothetical protein
MAAAFKSESPAGFVGMRMTRITAAAPDLVHDERMESRRKTWLRKTSDGKERSVSRLGHGDCP